NQLRMKIGVMFGSPETTTGGNALKFYASMRLDIRRIGAIKTSTAVVGNRTRVKVVKNKLAPPFREVEFDITYGEGVSREGMLIDMGVEQNVIEKSGAWLSYRGERVGQGRENAKLFLREHPEIAARVEAEILQKHGLGAPAANEGGQEATEGPSAVPKPEPKAKSKNPVGGRPSKARARA
ncbi:MAG: DNA recombination/repair protein RecA, partial [Myxococcales bacterium]|nr:DNA recombination/repair protein RecA [Myxococcales bacterium]